MAGSGSKKTPGKSGASAKLPSASAMKILVVDDVPEICELCRNILERDGYHVDTLTDPTKVIDAFRKDQYQIVILDLKFELNDEGMDGKTVLKELLHYDSDVCVVILSGEASEEDIIETLGNYKAYDFLRKPVSAAKLSEVIQKAIAQHGFATHPVREIALEVGRRVRAVRKEKHLTMRQLSTRIGLSSSLISQIERGESSPSVPTLYKISVALRLPLEKLFEGY